MDHDAEKIPADHPNDVSPVKTTSTDDVVGGIANDVSEEEAAHIMRRIDRRLVTTVGFMYCVSLMDRTNLGSASVAGLLPELNLTGNRYNIISLVFFTTYIVCQPPSTVICRKVGPRIHLALITLLWGVVMLGMGFVKTFEQMTALRVILGILEAGFFPSCVYLLSTWYTRYEVGKRNAMFYLLGCVASAFAGVLAAGLMQMKGLGGLNGWRWIFIIEGLITILLGIGGYWLLVDFPDSKRKTWNFLSDRERAWVVNKVHRDRGDTRVLPFHLGNYMAHASDWKIWAYAMIFFNTTTITYALAYFLPVILQDSMHFDAVKANCLVAPPYVLAGIVMFATSWVGDRYRIRGPIVIFNNLLCLIGLPIIGWHENAAVRYFGVFLVTAGANSNVPAIMSYQANNIRGQWKRALASATLVGFGGVGGIAGSLVFRTEDKPYGYHPGLYACITTSLLSIVLVSILTIAFRIENGKADRGEKELEASDEDAQPGFRYTY